MSVHLYVSLALTQSVYMSIYMTVCTSDCLNVSTSECPSMCTYQVFSTFKMEFKCDCGLGKIAIVTVAEHYIRQNFITAMAWLHSIRIYGTVPVICRIFFFKPTSSFNSHVKTLKQFSCSSRDEIPLKYRNKNTSGDGSSVRFFWRFCRLLLHLHAGHSLLNPLPILSLSGNPIEDTVAVPIIFWAGVHHTKRTLSTFFSLCSCYRERL